MNALPNPSWQLVVLCAITLLFLIWAIYLIIEGFIDLIHGRNTLKECKNPRNLSKFCLGNCKTQGECEALIRDHEPND